MRTLTFHRRTLTYYWRSNLAVALGVAAGTSALTGALYVGDSIRASLRDLAIGRLGNVDQVLSSSRYIQDPTRDKGFDTEIGGKIVAAIMSEASVKHAESDSTAHRVQVLGLKSGTGDLDPSDTINIAEAGEDLALVNQILADELDLKAGDEILIRLSRPADIARETLMGRRDQSIATLRIGVGAIVPADGFGSFTLRPRQYYSKNVFVPLQTLQRALGQPDRVNTLLVTRGVPPSPSTANDELKTWLRSRLELKDLGLQLRVDRERQYASLESSSFLIEPVVESTATQILDELGYPWGRVLTYLANSIEVTDNDGDKRRVPYSTVAAIDGLDKLPRKLGLKTPKASNAPAPGEIWLNDWAAGDLQASVGDKISLEYYVTGRFGDLNTRTAEFTLSGIVEMDRMATDSGFTPDYPGVTDTENLSDWDPPFPVELKLVRDQDETYWDEYRTAPKAFISLDDGRKLWAEQGERFGRLTSIRFSWPRAEEGESLTSQFTSKLRERLPLEALGLRFDPIRDRLLQAAQGSTDFGVLFVAFSFFLVLSAAMLVALLFRLGVERRAKDIGLLLATGFPTAQVARLLLTQGAGVAAIGTLIGLAGAYGYGRLMLVGLTTWWSAAVNSPFLNLHITVMSTLIGTLVSLLIALLAIAWSIRGLAKKSPKNLLAENLESTPFAREKPRRSIAFTIGIALCGVAVLMVLGVSGRIPATGAFFGAGFLTLIALVGSAQVFLQLRNRRSISISDSNATVQLGLRQAARMRSRSLLIVGLVASASFIIAAMEALRLRADDNAAAKDSGTGGFALIAESSAPLGYDLNSAKGREALNLSSAGVIDWAQVHVQPFRLQGGDESSCLNLYRPTRPRILGAPDEMIERGGFAFAGSMAELQPGESPWTLLKHSFDDGAIPVIGDEAAVLWQLKSGLGKDLLLTDDRGVESRLRFVALLRGSVLQSELIVAEENYLTLFPTSSGYSFFLIESPADAVESTKAALSKELSDFGFDVTTTSRRLNEYLAVQNTYLGTFQSLGGLGLALGTIGLAAVVLRNTWERRAEFGLMRAIGFPQAQLFWLVLVEHSFLVIAGLLAGTLAAALAICPQVLRQPQQIAWMSVTITLLVVFVTGLFSTVLATLSSLGAPVLASLRRE